MRPTSDIWQWALKNWQLLSDWMAHQPLALQVLVGAVLLFLGLPILGVILAGTALFFLRALHTLLEFVDVLIHGTSRGRKRY